MRAIAKAFAVKIEQLSVSSGGAGVFSEPKHATVVLREHQPPSMGE